MNCKMRTVWETTDSDEGFFMTEFLNLVSVLS